MTPFELLYEEPGPPELELPDELERLYGRGLGFEEPSLVADFVETIDGVVAIPELPASNALIAAGSEADRLLLGLLRAYADAVLVGSGTMLAAPEGTWRLSACTRRPRTRSPSCGGAAGSLSTRRSCS